LSRIKVRLRAARTVKLVFVAESVMKNRQQAAALLLLSVSLLSGTAVAMQSGKTPDGAAYVSGGVSSEEQRALHERRNDYTLWVITAASKSGSYLADVLVTIRDSNKRVVFTGRLDGPWLFIDLPLGGYEVEAALDGKAQRRTTTIHRGDLHQAFFYFDTGDQAGQEYRAPLNDSPYNDPRSPR
jgi:hypothetical protein